MNLRFSVEISPGFDMVGTVSFIYAEATLLLSKEFPEPKLRKMWVKHFGFFTHYTMKHMAQNTWGAVLPYGDSSC